MTGFSFRAAICFGITVALMPVAHAHHMMDGEAPNTLLDGMLSGLAHPVIGLDHFAFVTAVGLVAFATGRVVAIPAVFVLATIVGAVIHLFGIDLPFAEPVIILSLFLAGILLLIQPRAPYGLWGALFALTAVFHGYAYGESIVGSEATPLVSYFAGFAFIQFVIAICVAKLAQQVFNLRYLAARIGGGLVACVGALLIFGLMPTFG